MPCTSLKPSGRIWAALIVFCILPVCFSAAAQGAARLRGEDGVVRLVTASGQDVRLYSDYAALVIGVGDYEHWPGLPGAVRDAEEVAAALQGMGFQVTLAKNPTSSQLDTLLDKLPYTLGLKKDRGLFIYFAGHGATETLADQTKLGYVVPRDCPLPKEDPAGFADRGISMEKFATLARRVKSRHVLMAFDSCFSGSIFALGRAAPERISAKLARPVRQFITAGNEEEEVPDESVFKRAMLDGIRGDADSDRDGFVTGSELGYYLQSEVATVTRGAQHPQYGKIRNTVLNKGDFVFSPPRQTVVTPPGPPSGGGLNLDKYEAEAKRQEELRQRWDQNLLAMNRDYERIERLEGSRGLSCQQKISMWRDFQRAYGRQDNPFSREDEALREKAQKRQARLLAMCTGGTTPAPQPLPSGGGQSITNRLGMKFVRIPAGSFNMGSNSGDSDEKPVHRVTISKPFYMQTTEVTQAQWRAVMGSNPSNFKGDDLPVEQVSWNDAQEFIRKLNAKDGSNKYRLPTEAEWEYAARAGSSAAYCFGDDAGRLGDYAWYSSNSRNQTHPVGQKKPNRWGLYDMHGNVWEWVQDWYGSYSSGSSRDPSGPSSGSNRVLRGGSWFHTAGGCRSAGRGRNRPVNAYDNLGFRLAQRTP